MLRPLRVYQPTSVIEASAELARLGEDAKIYAGGTELILLLRQGLVHYTHIVDVKKIPELDELAWDGNVMHIGAAVTHRRLERSIEIAGHLPLLQQATELVANVRVRNAGTLGGNLCFGDPHSDPAPVLLVHDAKLKIGKQYGVRTIGVEEFFVGMCETALKPDELLLEAQVLPLPQGMRGAYVRAARFERPSLGVAVAAAVHDARLDDVRLAVSCVGPVPTRLKELESRITGATVAEAQQIVRQAERHYEEVLRPVDDLHGSVAYKIYLTGVFLSRALAQAIDTNGRD
jgi:carbon-monoxide dehydrogenase medium subunit